MRKLHCSRYQPIPCVPCYVNSIQVIKLEMFYFSANIDLRMLTKENLAARFTWIDFVILAVMLLISGAIGLYYAVGGNRQKTAKDILVANRSMGILPVTLSLLASVISAPAVLGVPVEIYSYGTSFALIVLSLAIAIPISAHVYLPIFYDLGVTSSYEALFLSIVTYVPALALSQVTGIYKWTSIGAIGIVCIIYTSLGGIKGVMWTDVFQILVMFAALMFVLIKGLFKVGGFKSTLYIAFMGNRLNTFNFSLSPFERHTFLEFIFGASLMWIAVYGTYQTNVQRYLTSPTKSSDRTTVIEQKHRFCGAVISSINQKREGKLRKEQLREAKMAANNGNIMVELELATRFGVEDYAVFVAMLAISMGIGIYYACSGDRQRTAKAFLMADKSMGVFPVSFSLFASFISAPAILGIPVEVYTYGTSYWTMTLSFLIVLPVTAYLYMPVFHDLDLTSSYEYLERRFNRTVRKLSSAIFVGNMIMFLAIVTYVPAVALSQVTGMHVWLSVSIIGIVCTIYTTLGGMKAVMWTDAVQILVMLFSIFDANPLERHTFWCLTIGAAVMWLSVYGVNQTQVQRYLTSKSKRTATLALWLNLPAQFIFISLSITIGLLVYAKYATCDPLSIKLIQSKIQILPLFVMESLSDFPGLPGLFVAGLFSASLSTLSSGLNSLAAVTLEDFVKPLCYPKLSERQAGFASKFIASLYGVAALGLVAVVEQLGNILEAVFSLFGMVSAPLFGLFTLGMFFPHANSLGAGVGFFSGLVVVLWLGIGAQIMKPHIPQLPVSVSDCNTTVHVTRVVLENITTFPERTEPYSVYNISYLWYSTIGMLIVIIVGLFVSYLSSKFTYWPITFQDPLEVDPRLLSPPIRRLFNHSQKYHLSTVFGPESDAPAKSLTTGAADNIAEDKNELACDPSTETSAAVALL
uniref:Sodium-dependent multivitamin transporter n=1 Tax=Strigamia maritima TaxID=126957 RepID=T1IR61_STRMM